MRLEAVRRWVPVALSAFLPEGRMLQEEVWRRRHRVIVHLAFLQAGGLGIFSLATGLSFHHAVFEASVVAGPLLVALHQGLGRKARSGAATISLFTASAVLVHLSGGLTEAHFHFFVMVGVVALYQDWVPFGLGLSMTVLHHGLFGTLNPHSVYGHQAAAHDPWLWAGVHGGFVLAASAAHLASWRLNEQHVLRDALTGLANRILLHEALTRSLTRGQAVSVAFVDLDDFKDVNDTRGHAAGDQVLLVVAERLRGCVRSEDDLVARLGGDEFAVMVAGGSREAVAVVERFLTAMSHPVSIEGQAVVVRASVGVADVATADVATADVATADVTSAAVLLRNADLAMYRAKASGKGRAVVYSEGMAQAAHDRAALAEDLGQALVSDQFELHYQATVPLQGTGTAEKYEALLRWHHPTRGLVSPLEFVPLAESSGHIHAIGAWALRTATAQAAAWSTQRQRPIGVAVNLSPVQLGDDRIEDVVAEALRDSGLPAAQLTLEVTESVLVQDVEVVAARLARLRHLGLRIAIDDFGTGYSSLSYLRQLPVDIVKIDRSFVSDLNSGGSATTLVASIIELARSLHLDVIAEGVETEQQVGILRDLQCGHAQGFFYARPVPASQVFTSTQRPELPQHASRREYAA